ncbi:SRPBCC family protein [Chitinimonas sp.]|uniref:SRPBCC family protein n=1 Tax=Chitinimonas sp. TaxID=1934313 RepID=UPI002F946BF1
MSKSPIYTPNPTLDLVLEREIDVPHELVWTAWTTPEHLVQWFCPRPWGVAECEIDLRPGGVFRTDMRSPEGQIFPNIGCFLEVVPQRKMVWTDALLPGYRPAPNPFMTAMLLLEPLSPERTRYTAIAIHKDPETRQKHIEMGFEHGWGTVLDQLVEHIKTKM